MRRVYDNHVVIYLQKDIPRRNNPKIGITNDVYFRIGAKKIIEKNIGSKIRKEQVTIHAFTQEEIDTPTTIYTGVIPIKPGNVKRVSN